MAIQDFMGENVADQILRAGEHREERGLQKGLAPVVRQFERRLGRALSTEERVKLADRLREQGPEKVGDVVLDLEKTELAAWLNGSG